MTSTIPPSEINLNAKESPNSQRLLATVSLGLVDAVDTGALSALDAAMLFFIPAFLSLNQAEWIDPCLAEALHAGSELNDILEIAPHGFRQALDTVKQNSLHVLRELGNQQDPLAHKWI